MNLRPALLIVGCALLGASACGGGAAGGGDSWQSRLALLPFTDPAEGGVTLELSDVATAAEIGGIEWPPADDEVFDALFRLAGAPDSPVFVPLSPTQGRAAGGDPIEVRAATGWAITDFDWVALVVSPPEETTVGAGRVDADAIAAALGDGPPWRIGEGEDNDAALSEPHALDRLGRPVTLALEGDVLGISTYAEGVEALSGDGTSLADVDSIRRLVEVADEASCYAVTVFATDDRSTMVCARPDVSSGPQVILAAIGLEDPEAEAARIDGLDPRDRIDGWTVTVVDDLIRVDIDGADDQPGRLGYELLQRFDPLVPGAG